MTVVKMTRHVFQLADIQALRLHCTHCGGEFVHPIKAMEVPKQCPSCHTAWEDDFPNGNRGDNWLMVRAMKGLLKEDSPRMTIRFEIDADSEEKA
ncbi:MAG: hypothetical protein OYI31_07250 [Chloroflexota bacterium]|nr:hypothetical protein [Chloroflexota bacterium]